MAQVRKAKPEQTEKAGIPELLQVAEEQFPGITELLKVYGGYDQMILDVRRYVEAAQQEPVVTTSDSSQLP